MNIFFSLSLFCKLGITKSRKCNGQNLFEYEFILASATNFTHQFFCVTRFLGKRKTIDEDALSEMDAAAQAKRMKVFNVCHAFSFSRFSFPFIIPSTHSFFFFVPPLLLSFSLPLIRLNKLK